MGKNKTIFVNAARLTVFCLAVVLIAALLYDRKFE